jgi:hypothetical protein
VRRATLREIIWDCGALARCCLSQYRPGYDRAARSDHQRIGTLVTRRSRQRQIPITSLNRPGSPLCRPARGRKRCYWANHRPNPIMAMMPTKMSRRIRLSRLIIGGSFTYPAMSDNIREVALILLQHPPRRSGEIKLS